VQGDLVTVVRQMGRRRLGRASILGATLLLGMCLTGFSSAQERAAQSSPTGVFRFKKPQPRVAPYEINLATEHESTDRPECSVSRNDDCVRFTLLHPPNDAKPEFQYEGGTILQFTSTDFRTSSARCSS
jgi:hypothetical protein